MSAPACTEETAAPGLVPELECGPIGLNSADIPGGTGSVNLDGPVGVGGMEWRPEDGHCWSATIGAALALETAAKAAEPV